MTRAVKIPQAVAEAVVLSARLLVALWNAKPNEKAHLRQRARELLAANESILAVLKRAGLVPRKTGASRA